MTIIVHFNNTIFQGVHGDLMEFVDRISAVLGCPVTLEDANHSLLAYSIHDDCSDPVRISTIISRRVPEKVINYFWKAGIIPALLKDVKPIIVSSMDELDLRKRAAVSIRKNNEVLGFIWALEETKPFTEDDLLFLQFSAKEAKNQLLQLQMKKNKRQENHQEFIWQLLTGHFVTEEEIKIVCSEQAIALPSTYSIIVFTFAAPIYDNTEKQIAYTLSTTQQIQASLYTIDQQKLIIIAGHINNHEHNQSLLQFMQTFISQMQIRFQIENIHGACGQTYHTYIDAKNSYQEALYALQLQQSFPSQKDFFTHYDHLGIYQYLKELHDIKGRNSSYSKKIKELRQYDATNQANLTTTLKTFLQCDANPNDTASILHIHVNTVHYRIKRISEMVSLNLKDPLHKMAFYIEFLLDDYEKSL
ncbi:MAG: PucR family transcriptional regulator [Bacillus sp. (in: firmicutes)]